MIQELSFEEKVKSMKLSEIVQAMLNGLNDPIVKLDMDTYGRYNKSNDICYGCAATNTICKINEKAFDKDSIDVVYKRAKFLKSKDWFVETFEIGIDFLRQADLFTFVSAMSDCNIIPISEEIRFQDTFLKSEFGNLISLDNINYLNNKIMEDYKDLVVLLKENNF